MLGLTGGEFLSAVAYRAEIDGLRAIAVASVVLFHAKLALPGGFVGVDVFFVISGYLITSIIVRELGRDSFSLVAFYERRVRRIVPALLVVIGACVVLGAWRMTPVDYVSLGRSAMAAIGFHSNFWFAENAGYFMPAAETLPLLHTWSLGVEEQFYVVAPLLLMLGARAGRWWLRCTFWALLALGVGLAVWGTYHNAETAFYLPHTRAFELLIGVGLGLGVAPEVRSFGARQCLTLIGLALIVAAALLCNEDTPFFAMLVPCVGAALIIHCADGVGGLTVVGRLLAIGPMVATGKISYSLYLWHWPLFAFAEYEWPGQVSLPARLALIAASVALAALTYRWIEQPARQSRYVLTQGRVFACAAAASLTLVAASFVIVTSAGWPGRLAPEVAAFAASISPLAVNAAECNRSKLRAGELGCRLGSKDTDPTFLLWGDSHASALQVEINELARRGNQAGLIIARGGCVPLFGVETATHLRKRKCLANAARVQAVLQRGTIRRIVLAARWSEYAGTQAWSDADALPTVPIEAGGAPSTWAEFERHFVQTLERLTSHGLDVVIIGPVPELPFHLPSAMIKARMRGQRFDDRYDYAAVQRSQVRVLSLLTRLEQMRGISVIYPHRVLCPKQVCELTVDGLPLYRDDNHLSELGVDKLKSELMSALMTSASR